MGRRGPPPKSTAEKIVTGNPGKRRLKNGEPKFSIGEIKMPAEVKADPVARAEWQRRAPELIKLGVLTAQDATEFGAYCRQASLATALWRKIKKRGHEMAIQQGIMKAFQIADAARLRLASRFGFTPADRSQVKVAPSREPSPQDEFFEDDKPAAKYFEHGRRLH